MRCCDGEEVVVLVRCGFLCQSLHIPDLLWMHRSTRPLLAVWHLSTFWFIHGYPWFVCMFDQKQCPILGLLPSHVDLLLVANRADTNPVGNGIQCVNCWSAFHRTMVASFSESHPRRPHYCPRPCPPWCLSVYSILSACSTAESFPNMFRASWTLKNRGKKLSVGLRFSV